MKRSLLNIESKPDANTLLLLHFDGNFKDSSKNNYAVTSSATFQPGKFGQAAGGSDIVMPDNIFHDLLLSEEFTIDYWYKVPGENQGHNILLGWDGGGMLYSAIRISCSRSNMVVFLEYNSGNSHGDVYNQSITELTKEYHHIALVRKGNRFMLFLDGVLKIDIVNNNSSTLGSNRTRNKITWIDYTYIDEFRVSNIARWTSNFTPPTKPYLE